MSIGSAVLQAFGFFVAVLAMLLLVGAIQIGIVAVTFEVASRLRRRRLTRYRRWSS